MIIGHQKQWDLLRRQVLVGRVSHALLFSGEEKLGKKKVGFEFLKFLNCQSLDFARKPCQNCQSCKQMEKKIHPDFFSVGPEKGKIGISQIRELTENLSLKPYFQWKTAIIDQAHSMTVQAQNCLLKTLEEPKGKTCLILITEHPFLLFKTILSRVQEIKFFPVRNKEILNYLSNRGVEENGARKITEICFGKPGQAIEFALDSKKMQKYQERLNLLTRLLKEDLPFRFKRAEILSKKPKNLKEVFDAWLNHLRGSVISEIENGDLDEALRTKKRIEEITEIQSLISQTNVNKRLALENLFLRI